MAITVTKPTTVSKLDVSKYENRELENRLFRVAQGVAFTNDGNSGYASDACKRDFATYGNAQQVDAMLTEIRTRLEETRIPVGETRKGAEGEYFVASDGLRTYLAVKLLRDVGIALKANDKAKAMALLGCFAE